MKIGELGRFIREQRKGSRLSLKAVSSVAGVSIPYLSQIERGLRKPSAEILQAIAKGLRISAETLYVQAGILEDRPVTDVVEAVMSDPGLTERHKQALVEIYRAFRDEAGRASEPQASQDEVANKQRRTGRAGSGRTRGGRAKTTARSSHRPPLRPSATNPRREV
jgi:transcriptional regulator with XRE-family HTH domain